MLRILSEVLSVLLRLLSLISGCAFSLAEATLKLGVSISSCYGKYLVDVVTVVTLAPFPLGAIQTKGIQWEH